LDDSAIQYFVDAKVVSEKVKNALKELVKRKTDLQQTVAKKQQLEQRIREIGEDQSRIRENMKQLDRASDVYKNYVKKFSTQETDIEKTRGEMAELKDQETGQRKSLDEFLMGLDME
jgi:DNA repair exonuclease SbcCD ATPase subunit